MWAACKGREKSVRLLLPVSDVLAQGNDGFTALMWAAFCGHEACIKLLLPTSMASAKNEDGLTASALAKSVGYKRLAEFIDAYALAQSERSAMSLAAPAQESARKSSLRV